VGQLNRSQPALNQASKSRALAEMRAVDQDQVHAVLTVDHAEKVVPADSVKEHQNSRFR